VSSTEVQTVTPQVARSAIEDFLYAEAAMLDDADYESWLRLFAEDSLYWIPNAASDLDPTRQVSLVYDDRRHLAERVGRIRGGIAFAQEPASRTSHAVTNVRIVGVEAAVDGDGAVVHVDATFSVAEFRRGEEKVHAGRLRYRLQLRSDGDLRIQTKKVELVNSAGYLGNLSLIL
jgi:benzoate/toluate 1,2-dioxygenase beta subunit